MKSSMKPFLFGLIALFWTGCAFGQHSLTYLSYVKDVVDGDTAHINVSENKGCLQIRSLDDKVVNPIPGYAESLTYVNYFQDSCSPCFSIPTKAIIVPPQ